MFDTIDRFAVDMVDDAVGRLQARGLSYAVIQMAILAFSGVLSWLAMRSAFLGLGMYTIYIWGSVAYLLMAILTVLHIKKIYWPHRRTLSLKAFETFWRMSDFNRGYPRNRKTLMAMGVFLMLSQLPSLFFAMDALHQFSQAILSFLPILLTLYAMCARPLPTKHTLSQIEASKQGG